MRVIKLVTLFISLLIIEGCTSQIFNYKALSLEGHHYKFSDGLHWEPIMYDPAVGRPTASLYRVSNGMKQYVQCSFEMEFAAAYCSKIRTNEEMKKIFGTKRHTFAFLPYSYGKEKECEFDTSQMYMIKGAKKIQLERVSYENTEILSYSKINLKNYGPRSYASIYYRTPWIEDELENVEIEIDGFYAEGIKAPPFRFRINYRDSMRWRCLPDEPKPNFFKRKWLDIKDWFSDPQKG